MIREAIAEHPKRLDIRLGYAAALSMRDRNQELADALKSLIVYGVQNGNEWYWSGDHRSDNGQQDMIDAVW